MPPKYVAQTSTEAKKAYKINGPTISERTHKQLQRGYELEQRAEREREAAKRRKVLKEKREEKERKEEQARKQTGVGLATQLIGYSHTQAHLKKGMEAFLGISKKREQDAQRKAEEKRKEEELAKQLEAIAQDIEKEPFDDDEGLDDAMLDLPIANVQDAGSWVDDELDDDTLLEVHDLIMSDPVGEPSHDAIAVPARPATTPPVPQRKGPATNERPPTPEIGQDLQSKPKGQETAKEDIEFTRTHGPVNKTVEAVLGNLPGEIVELLSHDAAAVGSDWAPAHGLLYKLNPIGLPPHRLRVKAGCVLVCLRDLNTSSQLSKSQHVRVLRVGNERLECLTLDGQLAGTKTVITRVPFPARYRNDDKFPFTRTQYPVRVATDYAAAYLPDDVAPSGFKLPSIKGRAQPSTVIKKPLLSAGKLRSHISPNPSFKLPGLPASRAKLPASSDLPAPLHVVESTDLALDGWDDFLESGTQIARELSAESAPKVPQQVGVTHPFKPTESAAPFSTQDLDFSLDDLDDEPQADYQITSTNPKTAAKDVEQETPILPCRSSSSPAVTPPKKAAAPSPIAKAPTPVPAAEVPVMKAAKPKKTPLSVPRGPLSRNATMRRSDSEAAHMQPPRVHPPKSRLSNKRSMAPPPKLMPPAKKICDAPPTDHLSLTSTTTTSKRLSDFGMSTQEATSFFDDDDDFAFGSPPIAV